MQQDIKRHYPCIQQTVGAFTFCKGTPRRKVTEKMPSLTCCEEMQDMVQKGKYGAVSSNVGTFYKKSLDIICKIHELRNISMLVKEEKSWLRKEISVPNGKGSISKEDMARYEDLIFNSPDGHAVLDNNNFILSSDLATIAGRRWLHYSILAGITKILQSSNTQMMVFMLNELLQMRTKDLCQVVRKFSISSVRCITFFVHVTNSGAGEVQFSTPQAPGCHWTFLYVDLTTNKWFYCDTAGWSPPKAASLEGDQMPQKSAQEKQNPFIKAAPLKYTCHWHPMVKLSKSRESMRGTTTP